MKLAKISSVLFLTLSSSALGQSQVWTVDDDGGAGVDFTDIPPAVAAAASGDVIVVRGGAYSSFTLDGKGVSIHGDGADRPQVGGFLMQSIIRNVPAGERVLLRNLHIIGHWTFLTLEDCTGSVWIEDVVLDGVQRVDDCASVTFVRFENDGAFETSFTILDSPSVAIYDSQLHGTLGPPFLTHGSLTQYYYDAIPVLRVVNSSVFLSGGTLVGADGINSGIDNCPIRGGRGGDGIFADAASVVRTLDTQVLPGAGGLNPCSGIYDEDGAQYDIAGTLELLPGTRRSLVSDSPAREGGQVADVFEGEPTNFVVMALSLDPAPLGYFPFLNGHDLLGPGTLLLTFGFLPASGTKTKVTPITDLGPGIEHATVYKQPLLIDILTLDFYTGAPSASLLLDAAF